MSRSEVTFLPANSLLKKVMLLIILNIYLDVVWAEQVFVVAAQLTGTVSSSPAS